MCEHRVSVSWWSMVIPYRLWRFSHKREIPSLLPTTLVFRYIIYVYTYIFIYTSYNMMFIHVPSPQSGASGICTKPSTNATRFLSLCSSSRRANSCEVPWGDGNGSPGCGPWDRTSEFSGDLICDLGIFGDQQYVWHMVQQMICLPHRFNMVCPI